MGKRITWTTQNVDMPEADFPLLEKWIRLVAEDHGRVLGNIVYVFCDDPYILQVNREFLSHDYYTDIITFDYTMGKVVSGDLVISLDTVGSNAKDLSESYDSEFLRVVIHGILHLCGINDKGPGEREIMEAHENKALAMYNDLLVEKSRNEI